MMLQQLLQASTCPDMHAACSAVKPPGLAASQGTPLSSSCCTVVKSPLLALLSSSKVRTCIVLLE
jgi:hypothetical protein